MLTNLHELIKEAIDKENEILLTIGQNTYYIENDKYSISIEYSLEKNDYFSFGGKYDFDIFLKDIMLIAVDVSNHGVAIIILDKLHKVKTC